MKLRRFFTVVIFLAVAVCGCQKRPMFEYSDEPYIYRFQRLEAPELKKMLLSSFADDRMIALRICARHAREAMISDQKEKAENYLNMIISHFNRERGASVRGFLVGVALRDAGIANDTVYRFLLECLDSGESAGTACLTLASLFPKKAYAIILPMTSHPRAELRYKALLALSTLRTSNGDEFLRNAAVNMKEPGWPAAVDGVPLAQCRENLLSRAAAISVIGKNRVR